MADLKRREFVLGAGLAAASALAGAGTRAVFAEEAGKVQHIPVRDTDTYKGLSVNVLDFRSKSDGKTDDTAAIRAAVKAAFDKRMIPLEIIRKESFYG